MTVKRRFIWGHAPASLNRRFTLTLCLLGAARGDHPVDKPRHEHEAAQHNSDPDQLQCEANDPKQNSYELDRYQKRYQSQNEPDKPHDSPPIRKYDNLAVS